MEKSIGKLNGCDIILRINYKHEYKCQRHIEFAEKLLTEWIREVVPFVWYNWQESKVEPDEKKSSLQGVSIPEEIEKLSKECDENWRTMVYIKEALESLVKRIENIEMGGK